MPIFIDPRGRATYGIGICGRCSRKLPLDQLHSDPNSPGLMVCEKDLDVLDPYRLPARETEDITLPFYRPDLPLTDFSSNPYPVDQMLRQRLQDGLGHDILDSNGNYIIVDIAPGPFNVPP